MPPKSTSLRPAAKRGGGEEAAAGVDLGALERFVQTAPALRRLLALPAVSQREMFLRAEMRRTIATLAVALDEVARGERRRTHAVMYRVAANIAADLAGAPATAIPSPAGGDH